VKRVLKHCCALILTAGIFVPATLPSQETSAPKKTAPAADIFSGTVTKLTDDSLTVVRKVLGHDAVTQEFARDGDTKVEGKLREKARVTVRYKAGEGGGFIAVYIIVR
jgi:hypothetical protein